MDDKKAKHKVIVLGHSGFFGQCLYESFSRDKNYDVFGFSSPQIDLSSQRECKKLSVIFDRETTVIMAATTLIKNKNFDAFHEDVAITLNIADILLRTKIRHLVFISSIAVYGRCSNAPINEESRFNPDDFYSLAKVWGELVLNRVCEDRDIALTILRPGIFYGSGDTRTLIFRFLNSLSISRNVEIYGDGSSKTFWIHKSDLLQVVKSVIDDSKIGTYNVVADERGVSLITLADLISKICGRKTEIKFTPSPKTPINISFDTSKFKNDFPTVNFIKLEDGIKEYLT